jgi:uncharacterized protein YidB (DUF937 family)
MMPFPSPDPVALGNISGNVDIDLTQGSSFTATLTGNVVFAVRNSGVRPLFQILLTQGGAGGYTVAWNGAGGATPINPFPLVAFNGSTVPGSQSVVWHTCDGTNIYNLGGNSSP